MQKYSNSIKQLYKHTLVKHFWIEVLIFIFLFFATVIINWKMIRDGLNAMTDLPTHMLWLQHFSKQISEGIWYPRWLAGTNYGYGSPTFVFYPPLSYYIGSALNLNGLNIEQTTIALFSLALFISGISFYIYGRSRWGKIASFTGAIAYMSTPYMAFDIYFRGGLSSMWAQALMPLGFWLTDQAILHPKWRAALALFFSIFALTHVPSLLIFTIVWMPYTLYHLFHRNRQAIFKTIAAALIGLGIASFYLLPILLEKSLVNIEIMKEVYGGFKANLFGTPLILKPHILLQNLRMQTIFIQQFLSAILLGSIALLLYKNDAGKKRKTLCWLAFLVSLSFIMSYLSISLWESSKILQMIQFPWRFLAIFSFVEAVLFGLATDGLIQRNKKASMFFLIIIAGLIFLNFKYSYQLSRSLPTIHNPGRGNIANAEKIKIIINEPDTEKLLDVSEYIPLLKTGVVAPPPVINQPPISVVSGQAEFQINRWGSYDREFNAIVADYATIRIRTYYYPAWHVYVNQKSYQLDILDDGTMAIKLASGFYKVKLRYQWTPAFMLGVLLSSLSIIALVWFWIKSSNILMSSP